MKSPSTNSPWHCGEVGELFWRIAEIKEFARHDTVYVVGGGLWKFLTSGLMAAAQLASFGVVIKLIDQIRWNALQRSK